MCTSDPTSGSNRFGKDFVSLVSEEGAVVQDGRTTNLALGRLRENSFSKHSGNSCRESSRLQILKQTSHPFSPIQPPVRFNSAGSQRSEFPSMRVCVC